MSELMNLIALIWNRKMETKVCTYTEKNVRLQLVRVETSPKVSDEMALRLLEIRLNRKVIQVYHVYLATEAKLYFSHCVQKILIDRNLSDLTS